VLRLPDAQAILGLWERAERDHPIDRALSILAAFTCESSAALATLPVHRRDALLLSSRVAAFGPMLEGVASCAACACPIEVSLDLSAVRATPDDDDGCIDVEGETIQFRVPNSHDLAAVAHCADLETAERTLLERCTSGAALDATTTQAIDTEIARLCAASSLDLYISCPQCQTQFVVPVDVGEFFWEEIASYARGLIEDVDALASRYGWSERDILALPERRRRRYLDHVR
jgi:hypothetical protein